MRISDLRELLQYAAYDEAINTVERHLTRRDLSARQRNELLEVLATAQLAKRDGTAARTTLRSLFARDPAYALADPAASPVIRAAFDEARESRPPTVQVVFRDERAPTALRRREAPRIELHLGEGGDAVEVVRLFARSAGGSFAPHEMQYDIATGTATAELRLLEGHAGAYVVEYYVEVFAPSGTSLGGFASVTDAVRIGVPDASGGGLEAFGFAPARRPRRPVEGARGDGGVDLGLGGRGGSGAGGSGAGGAAGGGETGPDGGSVLGKWWFWSAIGAAAAGAFGVYSLATAAEAPRGTLGTVTLR